MKQICALLFHMCLKSKALLQNCMKEVTCSQVTMDMPRKTPRICNWRIRGSSLATRPMKFSDGSMLLLISRMWFLHFEFRWLLSYCCFRRWVWGKSFKYFHQYYTSHKRDMCICRRNARIYQRIGLKPIFQTLLHFSTGHRVACSYKRIATLPSDQANNPTDCQHELSVSLES